MGLLKHHAVERPEGRGRAAVRGSCRMGLRPTGCLNNPPLDLLAQQLTGWAIIGKFYYEVTI